MNATKLRQYATDPLALFADLVIPGAHGPARFGDVMAPFQRERFASLTPAIVAVARGEKPPTGRYWWEATKGASKDSDLACCLLWLLAFTRRPVLAQVGAADADQAAELRKAAKDILRLNPWLAHRVAVENWKLVCDGTDSAAEIVPADVAGSHGARPDVLILNELSHITKEEFASNLMDNAAKVPSGIAIVATNAGFLDTWQMRWRELARTSPRWSFQQWSRPAPWLDPEEIAEAEERNTRSRFRRLFWGEWSSGVGDAIEESDIAASIRARGPMLGNEQHWQFLAGLDLGTRHDHAALVVLGANSVVHRVEVASCQSWKPVAGRIDLAPVRSAVLDAHRRFRLLSVQFDPYQAELMAGDLRRWGVNMVEVPMIGGNLNRMATAVLNAFRGRTIDLYPDADLLRDLRKLKLTERSFGYKLEAASDKDGHGDRAIALAIALPAAAELASHGWTSLEVPVPQAVARELPDSARIGVQLHTTRRLSQTVLGQLSRDPRKQIVRYQIPYR